MHLEEEVVQLRQRVATLEHQVALLMQTLKVHYREPHSTASPELLDLIHRGRKIEAIKLYREATGAGLKAAKDFIESLE